MYPFTKEEYQLILRWLEHELKWLDINKKRGQISPHQHHRFRRTILKHEIERLKSLLQGM